MRRRSEIEATLDRIFADHETSTYVGNVREELAITDDVSLVLAVCGMVPRGRSELNSAVNAIQTLLAVRTDGDWKLVDFQNTPAQYHGRPDLAEALTRELSQFL